MPTIRDFTSALRRRPGVNAVLVSGFDGLLIEGDAEEGLDQQDLAARIPSFIGEAGQLGKAAHLGDCAICIVEFGAGYAVVTTLGNDAILSVFVSHSADLGPLLFDIRSQRSRLEGLV